MRVRQAALTQASTSVSYATLKLLRFPHHHVSPGWFDNSGTRPRALRRLIASIRAS